MRYWLITLIGLLIYTSPVSAVTPLSLTQTQVHPTAHVAQNLQEALTSQDVSRMVGEMQPSTQVPHPLVMESFQAGVEWSGIYAIMTST